MLKLLLSLGLSDFFHLFSDNSIMRDWEGEVCTRNLVIPTRSYTMGEKIILQMSRWKSIPVGVLL